MSETRSKIRMHPERGVPAEASQYLAEGIVAHVGITTPQGPVIIPMTYHYEPWRPSQIYLHGGHHSRLMQAVASGEPVCVTVTACDGLVASKTALNHSVNYRSVVAFCRAAAVQPTDDEARALLHGMVARYWPGRSVGVDYEDMPQKHLDTTLFVAMDIEEVSAKRREGGPKGPGDDDPAVPGTAGVTEFRPGL